jgi:hypothetical protein
MTTPIVRPSQTKQRLAEGNLALGADKLRIPLLGLLVQSSQAFISSMKARPWPKPSRS